MSLSVTNFVYADIHHLDSASPNVSRDTVGLFLDNEELSDYYDCVVLSYVKGDNSSTITYMNGTTLTPKTFTSTDIIATSGLEDYLSVFFANGGVKVKLLAGDLSKYTTLDNDIVVIAELKKAFTGVADTNVTKIDALTGIKRKLVVGRIDYSSYKTNQFNPESVTKYQCLALKYSSVVGAEMAIAAYLSRINVYNSEDVKDYDFTVENGFDADKTNKVGDTIAVTENESLADIQVNFNMYLANEMRNIGGNLTNGNSLVEEYILIVLQQNLTNKLINSLSTKLKGQSGLSAIRTAISEELNKFVDSEYLATDQVWTYETLYKTNPAISNLSELIIEKNTPLTTGYNIHIFKMDSKRRNVYVFVILATTKGIRYIRVDGNII